MKCLNKQLIASEGIAFLEIEEAVREAIFKVERYFFENFALDRKKIKDISGCTLILLVVVGEDCYLFKIGKGEAILSMNKGQFCKKLTRSHKLGDDYKRVKAAGGKVYTSPKQSKDFNYPVVDNKGVIAYNPYRIYPGNLSISRTIGDVEVKFDSAGEGMNAISCEPDCYSFKLSEEDDYILLMCPFVNSRWSA